MSRTYKDRKPRLDHFPGWAWMKSGIPSIWKKLRRRKRRAENKHEIIAGKEPTKFRKTDVREWH